jgi:hypothetical protein
MPRIEVDRIDCDWHHSAEAPRSMEMPVLYGFDACRL